MIRMPRRPMGAAAMTASALLIASPGLAATTLGSTTAELATTTGNATSVWPHPADALPAESLGVLVLRDGGGQIAGLQRSWANGAGDGPLGELIDSIPNLGAVRIGWFGLSADARTDPWSAAAALLGDQLAIGLMPPADAAGSEPAPVLIAFAAGERGAIVDRMLGSVRRLAGIERGGRIDPDRQMPFAGGVFMRVSDQLTVGRRGPYLIMARDDRSVRAMLRRLDAADPDDTGTTVPDETPAAFAAEDAVVAATVPEDAAMWARLSPAVLEQMAAAMPAQLPNPLAAVLAGGWTRSLATAERTLGWMSWTGEEMRLGVDLPSGAELPATHAGFRTPGEAFSTIDARGLAGYVGEIAIPRDMASIVQQRESLMSTGAAGQLIEFVNGLSAIMGNFDVLEEVFARLGGPMRVVAVNRPPAAADELRPIPELPMFALVLPLDAPAPDLADRIRSGALTAMGIINIERGKQQQPGLLVDTDRVGDVRYVFGRFPVDSADGEAPDVSANFAPAIGVVRDRIVVATDPALLRSLATDATMRTEPAADELHMSGVALRDVLDRNRESIIADRMIKEGASRAEAESFTNQVLGVLAFVRDLGARVTVDDAATRGELVVRFAVDGRE